MWRWRQKWSYSCQSRRNFIRNFGASRLMRRLKVVDPFISPSSSIPFPFSSSLHLPSLRHQTWPSRFIDPFISSPQPLTAPFNPRVGLRCIFPPYLPYLYRPHIPVVHLYPQPHLKPTLPKNPPVPDTHHHRVTDASQHSVKTSTALPSTAGSEALT